MTEGLPGANDDMPTQLDDILKRLAVAGEVEPSETSHDDAFHVNAEAFPDMAEAAERVTRDLHLEILDGQQRMIEATAVAASVLWPNTHDDHVVHLLDSGLEHYRSAVDPVLYKKEYDELAEALLQARRSYLQTFWTQTHEGLLVPSLNKAGMTDWLNMIEADIADPRQFHRKMTTLVLPNFALMAKNGSPDMAETYLALRKAVEANAVGWIIDPFTARGRTESEVKSLIGWDNTSCDLLPTVNPFDGYADQDRLAYDDIAFMPRIVGGKYGGKAITEAGVRSSIRWS